MEETTKQITLEEVLSINESLYEFYKMRNESFFKMMNEFEIYKYNTSKLFAAYRKIMQMGGIPDSVIENAELFLFKKPTPDDIQWAKDISKWHNPDGTHIWGEPPTGPIVHVTQDNEVKPL